MVVTVNYGSDVNYGSLQNNNTQCLDNKWLESEMKDHWLGISFTSQ